MKKTFFTFSILILLLLSLTLTSCRTSLLTEKELIDRLTDITKQDAVPSPKFVTQEENQKSYQIDETITLDTISDPDTDALQTVILVINTEAIEQSGLNMLSYFVLNLPTILCPNITITDINKIYEELLPNDAGDGYTHLVTYDNTTFEISFSEFKVVFQASIQT